MYMQEGVSREKKCINHLAYLKLLLLYYQHSHNITAIILILSLALVCNKMLLNGPGVTGKKV